MHMDELNDMLHLWFFLLPFAAYQYWSMILVLLQSFSEMVAMIMLMQIKFELD